MISQKFVCNICGSTSQFFPVGDWRESPSCTQCGSSVRLRSIIHCLTLAIFKKSLNLQEIEKTELVGIGLSDWCGYADILEKKFNYKNTFYHKAPFLDITNPELEYYDKADFVISSEVFEHVPRPVENAFLGVKKILKENGFLVLSVPYKEIGFSVEHFPVLNKSRQIKQENGDWILVNEKKDGTVEIFKNIIFHGGPGTTIEMRVFGKNDLIKMLKEIGFSKIYHDESCYAKFGIFYPHKDGIPLVAMQ